jgi:hypothetical protein
MMAKRSTSHSSPAKYRVTVERVTKLVRGLTPEHEVLHEYSDGTNDVAVLTRHGWLDVHFTPFGDRVALHCRFEQPHLYHGGHGYNAHSGKWNHYLAWENVELAVARLLRPLLPNPDELPLCQFLAAVGRLLDARKSWFWERSVYGPIACSRRLRVLGQPGTYNAAGSVWTQPGQESFAVQDERAFWAVAEEFGSMHNHLREEKY